MGQAAKSGRSPSVGRRPVRVGSASRGWLFGARGRKHAVDTAAAARVRLSQTADVPLIVDG